MNKKKKVTDKKADNIGTDKVEVAGHMPAPTAEEKKKNISKRDFVELREEIQDISKKFISIIETGPSLTLEANLVEAINESLEHFSKVDDMDEEMFSNPTLPNCSKAHALSKSLRSSAIAIYNQMHLSRAPNTQYQMDKEVADIYTEKCSLVVKRITSMTNSLSFAREEALSKEKKELFAAGHAPTPEYVDTTEMNAVDKAAADTAALEVANAWVDTASPAPAQATTTTTHGDGQYSKGYRHMIDVK